LGQEADPDPREGEVVQFVVTAGQRNDYCFIKRINSMCNHEHGAIAQNIMTPTTFELFTQWKFKM
jgi:hypothetical protein